MTPPARAEPSFVVSLDFELFWGVYDVTSIEAYGANILGVRQALPAMLALFREYGLRATWATVGAVTFENKKDLLDYAPEIRPEYIAQKKDPYRHLESVGPDERRDPFHFGYSLAQQILDTPGMEFGSHTFSHLCAFEPRRNPDSFQADLVASIAANARLRVKTESLVFPRNQYDDFHLRAAAAAGLRVFRGTESHRLYERGSGGGESSATRAWRLMDAYASITGDHVSRVSKDESGLINVPSSRFLRPSVRGLSQLDSLRLRRIVRSMRAAAQTGGVFHLWWHPHNFGASLEGNIAFLREILNEFRRLRDDAGMRSLTMGETAVMSLTAPNSK